jgi:hypothetical protein
MEAREQLMREYRIRPEEEEEEEVLPPLPVIQLTQSFTPPRPSFIGSEMQGQGGRGRPPTVTIPPEIQQELEGKQY